MNDGTGSHLPQIDEAAGRDTWFWWRIAVVAGLAFCVRITDLLINSPPNWIGDPSWYHAEANLIAHGHFGINVLGQSTALHPPVFPLVLSVVSLFGGTSYGAHQAAGIAIGVGTVVAVGMLGREIAGPRVGVVAAALAAIYPNLWILDSRMWSEGLAAGLTAVTLLCAYRLRRRKSVGSALLLGAVLGLATLTRSEAFLLLVLVAIPVALSLAGETWRRRLLVAGATLVATLAVLAPWFIFNLATFEKPVPFSTNGGLLIAMTNCDSTYYNSANLGNWSAGLACLPANLHGDESEIAARSQDKGLAYLRQHTQRFATVVVWARVGRMWDLYAPFENARFSTDPGDSYGLRRLGLLAYWAVLPFFVVGAFLVHRRRVVPVWPLVMELVAITIVAAASYGAQRFRAPGETVILVLAAVALVECWRRLRSGEPSPAWQ